MPWIAILRSTLLLALTVAICAASGAASAQAACAGDPITAPWSASTIAVVEALPGPASDDGRLLPPRRVRVLRYDRGSGPSVLTVASTLPASPPGVEADSENEVPLRAGERWRLAGRLGADGTIATGLCDGSDTYVAATFTPQLLSDGAAVKLARSTADGKTSSTRPPRAKTGRTTLTLRAPGTVSVKLPCAERPRTADERDGNRWVVRLPKRPCRGTVTIDTGSAYYTAVLR